MRRIGLMVAVALLGTAAAAAEPDVLVLRGRPGPPPAAPTAAPAAPLPLAGDRLWLVDRDRGRLVGCRLERTARVGERRIRCAERTLRAVGF